VFRYLGRYTHRIAISNARLRSFQDGNVTFMVRDHSKTGRKKPLTLGSVEFIRRYLLHVLPKQLVRIRHFGLMAARNVEGKLNTADRILEPHHQPRPRNGARLKSLPWWEKLLVLINFDVMACPHCETGRLLPCAVDFRSLSAPPDTS